MLSSSPTTPISGVNTVEPVEPLSQSDSHIFAEELLVKKHGYPLWRPDPRCWGDDVPTEYIVSGVRIGDVGVVTNDGSFDCIFNVYLPPEDPINRNGVPDGFSPLTSSPTNIRSQTLKYGLHTAISSPGISRQAILPSKSQCVLQNTDPNIELNDYPWCHEGGLGAGYAFTLWSPGTVPGLLHKPCVMPIISRLLLGAETPVVRDGEVQDSNSRPSLQEGQYLFFQAEDLQLNSLTLAKFACTLNVMQSTGTSTSMEDLGGKYRTALFIS